MKIYDILIILIFVYGIVMVVSFVYLAIYNLINSSILARNPTSTNIYVAMSEYGGKIGRGVYANMDFASGDIIELTPYIEDDTMNFKGVVADYTFHKKDHRSILALGYASLCNHSDEPNATWDINDSYMIITANKPIKKDEEIFISYGSLYWLVRKGKK